jgi:hypothetical protein
MNKEPQNAEGPPWIFDISCSLFCGSKKNGTANGLIEEFKEGSRVGGW